AQFVRDMSAAPAPYSHDRHIYFVDFGQFGRPSPAYVNIIRDPVDRLVSSFYYRRAVATGVQGTGKPSRFWLSKSFQDCVRRGDEECTFAAGQTHRSLMMPYFCGHDVRCTTVGDPWALRTAMEHMDRHFAVVGVLEDMNATLALLERRLPAFFRGALQLYRQFAVHQNRNERRKPVPAEIREQLRHNLSTEYELYHLVRQRLYSQLRTLRQEDADARTWTRRSVGEYRLTKGVTRGLCDQLRGKLQRRGEGSRVLTVEQQVLAALRFCAAGGFQGTVGSDENIGVHQCSQLAATTSLTLPARQVYACWHFRHCRNPWFCPGSRVYLRGVVLVWHGHVMPHVGCAAPRDAETCLPPSPLEPKWVPKLQNHSTTGSLFPPSAVSILPDLILNLPGPRMLSSTSTAFCQVIPFAARQRQQR
ncbi:hypothetical protein HPB47_010670, partial [Ixodes persulcatus]